MSTGQTRPDAFLGFPEPRTAMQAGAADAVTGLGRVPMERTQDVLLPHFLGTQGFLPHLVEPSASPSTDSDPDWTAVLRVQQGDVDAFEDLVRRHGTRVRGTLAGMLRRDEDIEDAVQDTFLGAFQHIGSFHGHSKFLTWLTRIAINTALQRLRRRRKLERLAQSLDMEGHFAPRQIQAWQDDPATLYSKTVVRELVLKAVHELPLKYRVVVVLRDLQQLSTAETAAALDLAVPGVKARLLRGRLMLRKALAPHFTGNGKGRGHE